MESILPIRPENNRSLLKRSILLYRKSIKEAFLFSLFLSFVVFLPRILSYFFAQDIALVMPPNRIGGVCIIIIDLVSLLLFIAILWRVHCESVNLHESLREDTN